MSDQTRDMMAALEQSLPQHTLEGMRQLGLDVPRLLEELGLDAVGMEAMARDPVSANRALLDGPPPPQLSPDEARAQAEPMRTKILELYAKLADIVARHEATIQKRWAKKTKQQRVAFLLQVWPGMPRPHRPDFKAYQDDFNPVLINSPGRARWKDQALCPTINQEDLSQVKTLARLLNSRARNHPSVFAGTDRSEMSIGLRAFVLVPSSVPGYVMLLNRINDSTSDDYGKIVPRSMDNSALTTTTPEKQYSVGEGLLILEAQQRILSFLADTCTAILHEIPPDALTGPQYPILPEPKVKDESESDGYQSLEVLAQAAPYCLPTHFDTNRLVSLLSARASDAKDHLWSLREDPRYFHETLLEYSDHRNEYFWGNPDGTDGRRVVHWPSVLTMLLADAYRTVENFEELRRQAVELQSLQAKHSAQIDPSKDLPKEYMTALIKFRTYLWQIVSHHFTQLQEASCSSPPMRHMFMYSTADEALVSNPAKIGDVESHLLWLLKTLYDDDEQLKTLGLTMVMDELEHFISSNPKAKALISSYVGRAIGDLSILAQCYRQLELYQPWAQEFELQAAQNDSKLRDEYMRWRKPQDKICSAFKPESLQAAGKLANPAGGKFTYPIDKRRNKANVEKMREAEQNLDSFWRTIDRMTHVKLPGMEGSVSGPFLAQSRLLKRTAEWVEPESSTKKTGKQPDPLPDTVTQLSPFYFGFTTGAPRRPDLPAPTGKAKTKGVPNPPAAAQTLAAPEAPQTTSEQTLPVDARAFKVFRTLFFNPEVTTSPGEIAWKDFLHAMASVGFVAEKLYGSVWQFRPTNSKLDVEHPIIFHEPHPSPKIGFTTARRIGRRLFRQYGWEGIRDVGGLDKGGWIGKGLL
ncbi:hypothetical protein QBC34DRAFT_497673 [Podospora aff. communis PSN243]|uniref:Uncharacterized protein n=1 Tax=Podospora aff. communis PSN243 TaxID=3040156 RepID=A0AAV9GAN8_9PEZI|nr:hypothetical protein QBC34DRAFT_497673 [Podospora aff. communis PSN243]